MKGNALLFAILEESNTSQVTFGDDVKGNVIGKENINHSGVPILRDVRLNEELSANLINVS